MKITKEGGTDKSILINLFIEQSDNITQNGKNIEVGKMQFPVFDTTKKYWTNKDEIATNREAKRAEKSQIEIMTAEEKALYTPIAVITPIFEEIEVNNYTKYFKNATDLTVAGKLYLTEILNFKF